MNSEELEKSLRAEFESYLEGVLTEKKDEVSGFKAKIEEKLAEQRSEIKHLFDEFAGSLSSGEIHPSFSESVAEHLKLARDEGAKITAAAVAEAEELQAQNEKPANFADIRDAITDISSKNSQSEILKALVHHAAEYTPRGAFFIVKNGNLVGWKVFGAESEPFADKVKQVYFTVESKTSLSEAVENLGTVESSYGLHDDDRVFLDKLGFGKPTNIYAIPLIVRGRGVAVAYADRGEGEGVVNVEAIETLMRISGLTVELRASTNAATRTEEEHSDDDVQHQRENHLDGDSELYSPEHHTFSTPASTAMQFNQPEPVADEYQKPEPQSSFEEATAYSPTANDYPEYTEENFDYEPSTPEQNFQSFESETPVNSYDSFEPQVAPETDFPAYEPASESFEQDSLDDVQDTSANADYNYTSLDENTGSFDVSADDNNYNTDLESRILEETRANEVAEQDSPVDFSFKSNESIESNPNEFNFQSNDVNDFESNYSSKPAYEPEINHFESETLQSQPDEDRFTESNSFEQPTSTGFDTQNFDTSVSSDSYEFENGSVVNEPAPAANIPATTAPITVESASSTSKRSRFGDRNVDLPIEVAEDERRYHNDARRFARLLVSEIKLYNEQKVREGRETGDLYERLREAIDRSREMYDKRVQPPVAAKFDYFNYELVNTLAEGDEGKLGAGYPGASV
ncbi:MAG: hypothetical protein ACK5NT_10120 [Pyrinomonadaceae bacterium]